MIKTLLSLSLLTLSVSAIAKDGDTTSIHNFNVQPWTTNDAFMEDPYSKKYALAEKNRLRKIEGEKKSCLELTSFPKRVDCLAELDEKHVNPYPERGTEAFVLQKYIKPLNGKAIKPKQLKKILTDLEQVRLQTRQVSRIAKGELGELTFEQVNGEICILEEKVGFLSSGKKCIW